MDGVPDAARPLGDMKDAPSPARPPSSTHGSSHHALLAHTGYTLATHGACISSETAQRLDYTPQNQDSQSRAVLAAFDASTLAVTRDCRVVAATTASPTHNPRPSRREGQKGAWSLVPACLWGRISPLVLQRYVLAPSRTSEGLTSRAAPRRPAASPHAVSQALPVCGAGALFTIHRRRFLWPSPRYAPSSSHNSN